MSTLVPEDLDRVVDWLRGEAQAADELSRYSRHRISRVTWTQILAREPLEARDHVQDLIAPFEVLELDARIAAAAADIEAHRKRDHALAFRYESGAPAAGIKVRARLVRHDFGFGGSVKASTLALPGNDRVRGLVTNWFNRAVFENDLKWGAWENAGSRPVTVAALDWLRRAGIPVRGHNLVWPISGSPADSYLEPGSLRAALNDRVTTVAGHPSLRGLLVDWDVVNEPTPYEQFVDAYRGTSLIPGPYANRMAFAGEIGRAHV